MFRIKWQNFLKFSILATAHTESFLKSQKHFSKMWDHFQIFLAIKLQDFIWRLKERIIPLWLSLKCDEKRRNFFFLCLWTRFKGSIALARSLDSGLRKGKRAKMDLTPLVPPSLRLTCIWDGQIVVWDKIAVKAAAFGSKPQILTHDGWKGQWKGLAFLIYPMIFGENGLSTTLG